MTQKHKESGAMKLRLLSPERLLYEGEVESLIVKTQDGYEGFLRGRAPCCKLLAAQGDVKFRIAAEAKGNADAAESAPKPDKDGFLKAITRGGFLYMNGDIIVYADAADWA